MTLSYNFGKDDFAEAKAPGDSVLAETAVPAQTKARKEDWRRIAGV